MSYLDELSSLLGTSLLDDESDEQDGQTLPARTTLEEVRAQLDGSSLYFIEGPEGHFVGNGNRRGCGFATVEIDVDEQAGTCAFDINARLRVAPENARAARRMMRVINNTLIQTGLALSDDGVVHFVPEVPIDVRGGDSIADAVGRGFTTIHEHSKQFIALSVGTPAWELVGE